METTNTKPYTHHTHVFTLESGERVMWNIISGYAVEKDWQHLVQPTTAEQAEIDQLIEDAAFAEECEREKRATYEAGVRMRVGQVRLGDRTLSEILGGAR
jgi:hypothetical protein